MLLAIGGGIFCAKQRIRKEYVHARKSGILIEKSDTIDTKLNELILRM